MFFPYFTHTLVFILLIIITDIKRAYTDDATENHEKGRANEYRKMLNRAPPNKPLHIPCQILTVPMDRVKSALKDLELMNELYCNANGSPAPVETSRADTHDETPTNLDQELTAQYHQGQNPHLEQDPLGQRTINYPLHYSQPWMHYPNAYPYQYADRSALQNPNYYYPGRSPYIQLYSGLPAGQAQSGSMVEPNQDFQATSQGTPVDTSAASDDLDSDYINTLKKKARKYDKHCAKKRITKRLENTKTDDQSDYVNSINDTDQDVGNSTEMRSN